MYRSHIKPLFTRKWTWDRVRRMYVLFQLRQNQGSTYTGEIFAIARDGTIFLPLILLLRLPVWSAYLMLICYMVFMYVLGYIDETYLHIWQKGSEISTREYNPYFEKIEREITEIKEMLRGMNKDGG